MAFAGSLARVFISSLCLTGFALDTTIPVKDRLAFANNLTKRGLHAEALKEYEALRNDPKAQRDEVLFRIGEAQRLSGQTDAAIASYAALLTQFPASAWGDYARLNRALLTKGPAREKDLISLDRPTVPLVVRQNALYYLATDAQQAHHSDGAADLYGRVVRLCATNEVGRIANLRYAAILSTSDKIVLRRRAMAVYYELSFASDARLAEEASFFAVLLCYREKRYTETAALYKRLAERFPVGARTQEARLYGAWANYLTQNYVEALKLAVTIMEQSPDSEDAAYLKAVSLRGLERRDEALEQFCLVVRQFPKGKYSDMAWGASLELLASSGRQRDVLDALEARGTPPVAQQARSWVLGYEAAIAVTNTALALTYARRAATVKNTAVITRARYVQGVLEARQGQSKAAIETWVKLLADYPECLEAADVLRARASEELRLGDYRAARHTLDDFVKRFPKLADTIEVIYWRGVAARGTDDAPEAERLFRIVLTKKGSAEFMREARLELASLLQKRGAEKESASLFAELLDTKASERLGPASLAWLAETSLNSSNYVAALSAAQMLCARQVDASWNQIGAALEGRVREKQGQTDAAHACYVRSLGQKARTDEGAHAALALGRIESNSGHWDEARKWLSDAVERAHAENLLAVRARAYAALADNEYARGNRVEALRFYMLVGTLFDDKVLVPKALERAAELLRDEGRNKEADDLIAELNRRYSKTEGTVK